MNRTKIEWVRNPDGTQGYTWNPITGCLNHINGLCNGGGFPCYAYKLANGRLKQRYLANGLVAYDYDGGENGSDAGLKAAFTDPFYPRFWEERLLEPLTKMRQLGVFVCDMSDLFGIGIPEEWTNRVLEIIKFDTKFENTNRYYLLTKQPQNLIKFSPFPENCWVGVTACNIDIADEALNYLVYKVDAKVKFISFEPLLGSMGHGLDGFLGNNGGIGWLIIGTQTNPYKPPEIEWVREIVEAADKARIPVFLKDNLRPLLSYPKDLWAFTKGRYHERHLI